MTPERLKSLIASFPQARIAVLGDFFLDKYLTVDAELAETSVETGKVAHQVIGMRCSPGAAGTVVGNLAALGAQHLCAIGYTGDDGESWELRRGLVRLGCRCDDLAVCEERFTPTYLKPHDSRIAGLPGEHSRYDTKNRQATPPHIEDAMIAALQGCLPDVDAVIVLDQVDEPECGCVTTRVREAVNMAASRNADIVFWADSRARIHDFRHVTIKANEFEAMGIYQPPPGTCVTDEELQPHIVRLRASNGAPIVVTRADRGVLVSDPDWTVVPAVKVAGPIDSTGAGDSFTAGSVLALCAGATLAEAAEVGTLVASITIQQLGTTGTASPEQLRNAIATP
ncbi:MAG: carbohydrate kinase [Planctomycetales bacterium]|nr:carbohydrate kinase [Planctomycetales bacterium]